MNALRNVTIFALLCLLSVLGCRGKQENESRVPIRRETPATTTTKIEPVSTAQSIGDDTATLLGNIKDANDRYSAGEITKQERAEMAERFEEDTWGLMQRAKSMADKEAKDETDPKRKAFAQELDLFLLLYLGDLHSALCAERVALQTDKPQWNKRANAQAQPLISLANSIRWASKDSISLPKLSPGPGKLPSPPAASKNPAISTTTTTSSSKTATNVKNKKSTTKDKTTSGSTEKTTASSKKATSGSNEKTTASSKKANAPSGKAVIGD